MNTHRLTFLAGSVLNGLGAYYTGDGPLYLLALACSVLALCAQADHAAAL